MYQILKLFMVPVNWDFFSYSNDAEYYGSRKVPFWTDLFIVDVAYVNVVDESPGFIQRLSQPNRT